MKREDLLAEMRKSIGTQDPVVFFEKMVDVFDLLFNQIAALDSDLKKAKMQTALAIQWEPKVALTMLADQINILRQDKDTYFDEISELKKAFAENIVTLNYDSFCKFWVDVLGWHPFLEYK
jgi:hypothetical protein